MDDKVKACLGLAQRAGKLLSGRAKIYKSLARNEVKLLILAVDASESTVDDLRILAEKRNIPLLFYGLKEEIGEAIGKGCRFGVAVSDIQFADKLKQLIEC